MRAINKLILDDVSERGTHLHRDRTHSQLCQIHIDPSNQSTFISFVHKGDRRTLSTFFQLDPRHIGVKAPEVLWLSMEKNALSSEVMPKVLFSLSMLGPTAQREQIHGDAATAWKIFDEGYLDYLDACKKGLETLDIRYRVGCA